MAKWIALSAPFDYRVPGGRLMVSYQGGYTAYMPNAHAEAAIAAGVGTVTGRPQGAKVSKSGAVTYERAVAAPERS